MREGHIEFTYEILEHLSLANANFLCVCVYLMKSLKTRSVHLFRGLAKNKGKVWRLVSILGLVASSQGKWSDALEDKRK